MTARTLPQTLDAARAVSEGRKLGVPDRRRRVSETNARKAAF